MWHQRTSSYFPVLLLGLTLLEACGMAQPQSTAPKATPSPTVDPLLQRYAVAVHRYYQPFSAAINDEDNLCRLVQPTPWTTCQSLTATVFATGQTLLAQLPATLPPAQLQTMDTTLKQAAQAALSAYMQRAPAVAAHNSAAFNDGNVGIGQAVTLQCDPVQQFNAIAPWGTHIETPHGNC